MSDEEGTSAHRHVTMHRGVTGPPVRSNSNDGEDSFIFVLQNKLQIIIDDLEEIYAVGLSIVEDSSQEPLFSVMAESVQTLYERFLSIYDKLCDACGNMEIPDSTRKKRNTAKRLYYAISLQAKELTSRKSLSTNLNNNSLNTSGSSHRPRSKLPIISLPEFSGDQTKWITFRDTFQSLVLNDPDLSPMDRFHYLVASLKGSAAGAIADIALCEDNFADAWQSVLDTYNNPRLTATAYLDKLLAMEPLKTKPTIEQLKSLTNKLSEWSSSFNKIEIEDRADFLILYLTRRCLDFQTRHEFELLYDKNTFPKFKDFIKFLKHRGTASDLAKGAESPATADINKQTGGKFPRMQFRQERGRNALLVSPSAREQPVEPYLTPEQTETSQREKLKVPCSPCPFCKQAHPLIKCLQFHNMSAEQRVNGLLNCGWRGCKNCLFPSHTTKQCVSRARCRYCRQRHNSLIHVDMKALNKPLTRKQPSLPSTSGYPPTNQPNKKTFGSSTPALSATTPRTVQIILGTAVCSIIDGKGYPQEIRLVLDSGSQFSFLTRSAAVRLGLTIKPCEIDILGIGQTPCTGFKGRTHCKLLSNFKPIEVATQALVVDAITSDLPTSAISEETRFPYQNYVLADQQFWKPRPIDFLLGGDLFAEVLTGDIITLAAALPKLIGTIFGYVVLGRVSDLSEVRSVQALCATTRQRLDSSIIEDLQHLWEIEEPTLQRPSNPEDDACEEFFKRTHSRLTTGRYVVRLPFKTAEPEFPSTRGMAMRRLASVEGKLSRNSELCQLYSDFMKEYEDLGHMTPVTKQGKYIIPHHCVTKTEGEKLKIRVVFDASASTPNGSLNNHLHVGPKLQNSITTIMLNFRRHKIVFTVDLVKMFRQVLVHQDHRIYQHILWRPNPSEAVKEYELCTVSYGQAPAPYLAIRAIKQLVIDEGKAYPLAATAVANDMYVDDLATGASSVPDALELQRQVIALMAKGEFPLSKWASNHPALLNAIREKDDISKLPKKIEDLEDRSRLKILGLQWDSSKDVFSYNVSPPEPVFTKRAILAAVARIYDPLGLLSPIVISPKALIQAAWKSGADWDQALPLDIQKKWYSFIQQLPLIARIEIPRWVSQAEPISFDILIFGDASELAYCATAYLKTSCNEGSSVHLLMSKSKLAPIKRLTIPRLELCAALLAVKLADQLSDFYDNLPHQPKIYFFSDSTVVLGWLKTPAYKLKTFVGNRVTRILHTTSVSQWFHVRSEDNPSDLGSRGVAVEQLINNHLWFHGPDWALKNTSYWSLNNYPQEDQVLDALPEMRTATVLLSTPNENAIFQLITSTSSYHSLLRKIAWARRFIFNCRVPTSQRATGSLSLQELKSAQNICIRICQNEGFGNGKPCSVSSLPKNLTSLQPFLDEEGLLRVGGRLKNANTPFSQRHPILIPAKSHLATLIIDFYHKLYLHPGPSLMLSVIRRKYWMTGARNTIRKFCRNCVPCRRFTAPPCQPVMADLPPVRFEEGRAFLHVGVDFAGPFLIRDSLRRKAAQSKCYLSLFICLTSRAIHLEAVSAISTPAFLAAFDRFISRRGLPNLILSDNGTNFVGAANQLREWYQWFYNEKTKSDLINYSNQKDVEWRFIPPHAPHFGGMWEAGVRSAKRLLRSTYGEGVLTFEEISTLFARIEAILNSRPMCPLSPDPDDIDALTPGHLLIGGPLIVPPEPTLLDLRESRLNRWEIVKQRSQLFWNRWKSECLHEMQVRSKWITPQRNLQVGDLVLIAGEETPRAKWPLGRIVEVFPGNDGVVRVARVRTALTILQRPATKLVPLQSNDKASSLNTAIPDVS